MKLRDATVELWGDMHSMICTKQFDFLKQNLDLFLEGEQHKTILIRQVGWEKGELLLRFVDWKTCWKYYLVLDFCSSMLKITKMIALLNMGFA